MENMIGRRVNLAVSHPLRLFRPIPLAHSASEDPQVRACLELLLNFRLQLALRTGISTEHPPPLFLVSDSGTTLEPQR